MKAPRIVVVDYGIGNVRSMVNAVLKAGGEPVLSRKAADFRDSAGLILPGVGAFAKGMENLAQFDLVEQLKRYVDSGRPVLGVCLGLQMMMSRSFEFGETAGLDMIAGDVHMLPVAQDKKNRVPHIGWAKLEEPSPGRWRGTLLADGPGADAMYYFVHSFVVAPANETDAWATAHNGETKFVAAIERGNMLGVQFHPEKSGPAGLALLTKFVERSARQ